jgi:hypothetical protein
MRAYRATDLSTLHSKLCNTIIHSTADKLDVISSVDVAIHNVIAEAESMAWDFNLKSLWVTQSRWSMMAKQYIDGPDLQAWIDKVTKHIGQKDRGIALMRTKLVLPRGGPEQGNKETRRWGSCMVAISYKAVPRPQITLYSRTSYLGYLSGLDLSIAWMCGKYLAHELGMNVEDISFVWMNEAMQFHNFKSLAFMLNNPDPERRKEYRRWMRSSDEKLLDLGEMEYINERPALMLSRKWLQKLIADDKAGKTLGDMTYNTYRRIRRRYHTEVLGYERAQEFEGWSYYKTGPQKGEQKQFFKAYGPLPSVSIHDLDFKAIKVPFGQRYGSDFEGAIEDDEEDDE